MKFKKIDKIVIKYSIRYIHNNINQIKSKLYIVFVYLFYKKANHLKFYIIFLTLKTTRAEKRQCCVFIFSITWYHRDLCQLCYAPLCSKLMAFVILFFFEQI